MCRWTHDERTGQRKHLSAAEGEGEQCYSDSCGVENSKMQAGWREEHPSSCDGIELDTFMSGWQAATPCDARSGWAQIPAGAAGRVWLEVTWRMSTVHSSIPQIARIRNCCTVSKSYLIAACSWLPLHLARVEWLMAKHATKATRNGWRYGMPRYRVSYHLKHIRRNPIHHDLHKWGH